MAVMLAAPPSLASAVSTIVTAAGSRRAWVSLLAAVSVLCAMSDIGRLRHKASNENSFCFTREEILEGISLVGRKDGEEYCLEAWELLSMEETSLRQTAKFVFGSAEDTCGRRGSQLKSDIVSLPGEA
jgi:hypothetical protein